MDKYGCVIPLDYVGQNQPSLLEDSVVFYSRDWSDLRRLLTNPIMFLGNQPYRWRQTGKGCDIPWLLLASVSATIDCGLRNPRKFVSTLMRLQQPISNFVQAELPHGSRNVPLTITEILRNPDLMGLIVDRFLRPSFFAEFNVFTHGVQITYFPPVDSDATYDQEFPNPILATTEGLGGSLTTLHFDLGRISAGEKAEFAVSYLENPDWFTQRLTELARVPKGASSSQMQVFRCALTEQSPEKEIAMPSPIAQSDDLTFTTEPLPAIGESLPDFLASYAKFPSLDIREMGGADPCCGTGHAIADPDNSNTFHVGRIILQNYNLVRRRPHPRVRQEI